MKQLVIEEKEARSLYKDSSKEFKIILENTFGKEYFYENIINKIKSFKDILKLSNKTEEEILPWKFPRNKQQISQNALAKIQLISEVLNEGININFLDNKQYKYRPWFERKASGWVVDSCAAYGYSGSDGGFGLYYKSEKLALFAGNTFLDIYIDFLPE